MEENPYDSPAGGANSFHQDAHGQSADAEYYASLQEHVNSLLIRGIVFSIIWIMGFGSAYSVFLAFQARRIIKQSEGAVRGMGRVLWCFVVGGFGVCVLTLGLIWMFINSR